jgi:hypothetical protein
MSRMGLAGAMWLSCNGPFIAPSPRSRGCSSFRGRCGFASSVRSRYRDSIAVRIVDKEWREHSSRVQRADARQAVGYCTRPSGSQNPSHVRKCLSLQAICTSRSPAWKICCKEGRRLLLHIDSQCLSTTASGALCQNYHFHVMSTAAFLFPQ